MMFEVFVKGRFWGVLLAWCEVSDVVKIAMRRGRRGLVLPFCVGC